MTASGLVFGIVILNTAIDTPTTSAPAGPWSVSVVIPTYNRAHLIGRSIRSALANVLPGDEIIVVDDGSKDDTAGAVAAFGDRVRYIRQNNAGAGPARNTGLNAATRPLVAMLDSDDEWLPGALGLHRALLAARPDVIYSFSDFMVKKSETEVVRNYVGNWHRDPRSWSEILSPGVPYSSIAALPAGQADFAVHIGSLYESLMATNYVATFTLVIRREMVGSVRFSEDLHFCEDWELFAQLAQKAPVAYLDIETAVQWGHDGPRLTDTNEYKMASSRIRMIERNWGNDPAFVARHDRWMREILADQHRICARWLLGQGRTREARQELRQAPGSRKLHHMMSFLPGPLVHAFFTCTTRLREFMQAE